MVNRPAFVSRPLWQKIKRGGDELKIIKRQILRFPQNPRLVAQYSAYRRAIKGRDWPEVLERVRWIADYALKNSDRRLISEMAPALERLSRFQEAATLRRAARKFVKGRPENEWEGQNLSGKKLLVNFRETPKQGLGFAYRGANLVAKAARQAAHVGVIVEPRLVPTYRRSFPELEIAESMDEHQKGRFDYIAVMASLAGAFAPENTDPDPDFHPLIPDPSLAAKLRARYAAGRDKPLIGICWDSGHHGKLLPPLPHWRRFIDRTGAIFVSLQYGDVAQDIEFLGADRVIVDPSIDQLIDMDDFAGQVAALDGVITITATLGHVAGALGTPTAVLRDDWFRREWPVMSDRVPWYPHLRAVGKDGREWDAVFDDAWSALRGLMGDRKAGP